MGKSAAESGSWEKPRLSSCEEAQVLGIGGLKQYIGSLVV